MYFVTEYETLAICERYTNAEWMTLVCSLNGNFYGGWSKFLLLDEWFFNFFFFFTFWYLDKKPVVSGAVPLSWVADRVTSALRKIDADWCTSSDITDRQFPLMLWWPIIHWYNHGARHFWNSFLGLKMKRRPVTSIGTGPQKPKKLRQQEFLTKYCDIPGIVESSVSKMHARCKYCEVDFSISHSGKFDIDRHCETKSHRDRLSRVQGPVARSASKAKTVLGNIESSHERST